MDNLQLFILNAGLMTSCCNLLSHFAYTAVTRLNYEDFPKTSFQPLGDQFCRSFWQTAQRRARTRVRHGAVELTLSSAPVILRCCGER